MMYTIAAFVVSHTPRMAANRRFSAENRAVTAIEYAIIAGIIAIAIVGGIKTIGPNLVNIFNNVGSEL